MEIENSQFLNNYLDTYKCNDIFNSDDPFIDDKNNFVWENILVCCRLYSSSVAFIKLTKKGEMRKSIINYDMAPGIVNWFWVGQKNYYFAFGYSEGSIIITTIDRKTGLPFSFPTIALVPPLCFTLSKPKDVKLGNTSQLYTQYPIHCLSGNEETHILASLSNLWIWVHSLNNGDTLNMITLSSICKNVYGLQLSKYGYVIWGRVPIQTKDAHKYNYFIQLIDINGEVIDWVFVDESKEGTHKDSPIRGFKISERGVDTQFKETSDVDVFFKRTMDDKVFYFTKTSWYVHSWVDKNDHRKICHKDKSKIKLRHLWSGSYKIIGENETKNGVKEYRILEPKSEFTEKWLNYDVFL